MAERDRIYNPSDLIEGNLTEMTYMAEHDEAEVRRRYNEMRQQRLGRSQTVFEIGKRAMRRITRSGK